MDTMYVLFRFDGAGKNVTILLAPLVTQTNIILVEALSYEGISSIKQQT